MCRYSIIYVAFGLLLSPPVFNGYMYFTTFMRIFISLTWALKAWKKEPGVPGGGVRTPEGEIHSSSTWLMCNVRQVSKFGKWQQRQGGWYYLSR